MPGFLVFHYFLAVVQLFSCVQSFLTSWTTACQSTLSFTISQNLLKLVFIGLVRPYHHLVFCHLLSLLPSIFPSIRVIFQLSQFFTSDGRSTRASVSVSVLSMNVQDRFPLGLTGLICLQSKGLSRVLSNTTVHNHQLFSAQPSLGSNSDIHTCVVEKS